MRAKDLYALRGIEIYRGRVCEHHPHYEGERRVKGSECTVCAFEREAAARQRCRKRGVPYPVDVAFRKAKVQWMKARKQSTLMTWLIAP